VQQRRRYASDAIVADRTDYDAEFYASEADLANGHIGRRRAEKKAEVPTLAARASVTKRPEKRKSWFDLFAMPGQTLKGQITGLSSPEGLCEDASGNIWVADTGAEEMLQYSRTGTLLRTLIVPNEFPASCAVDHNSGDLAISNIESTSGTGNITIFKNGSGSGTPLQQREHLSVLLRRL
jgi:hypothetical protein